MINFLRGSEWRRWDLHVHTPKSILYNGFGNDFDEYVKQLFKAAISNGVCAIGITDYFSIDGYKQIREEYLNNPIKMNSLFTVEELKKVYEILLLPNIEFRLNTFVGSEENSINFHVILSDKIPIVDIEQNFLSKIDFTVEGGTFERDQKQSLTRHNLIQFGKQLKEQHASFTGDDYKVGVEHATVSDSQISEILSNNIFANKYILCVPADKDLNSISWDGRDHTHRKVLIQKSNCLFTANKNNIEWGLGHKANSQEDFITEFKALKPCIHGSDAHEFSKLFKPDNDKYCWIKADSSFDGLMQILYEPETRVKIQSEKPDKKADYSTIDYVEIRNTDFSESANPTKIYFNPNLTCIIGGKSTGKSLLLNNMAYAVDSEQINQKYLMTQPNNRISKIDKFSPFDGFKVFWSDGTENSQEKNIKKKIVYIPQTYLNRLSDEKQETTEIDELIEGIVLQHPDMKIKFSKMNDSKAQLKIDNDKLIYDYIDGLNQMKNSEALLLENNSSIAIEKEISKLEKEKQALITGTKITEEQSRDYGMWCEELSKLENEKTYLENDKAIIASKSSIAIQMPIEFQNMMSSLKDELISYFQKFQEQVDELWIKQREQFQDKIDNRLIEIAALSNELNVKINGIKPEIEKSSSLIALTEKIGKEKEKLHKAQNIEKELTDIKLRSSRALIQLVSSMTKYKDLLQTYVDYVNSENKLNVEGLEFKLEVVFRADSFKAKLFEFINNKTFSRFKGGSIASFNELSYTEEFVQELISSLQKNDFTSLELKNQYTFENVLRELLSNWYNINYVVTMDDDEFDKMSPGKKALVLLKLLIGLAESDCPMLIDQPEDDLDNRSIFDDLVKYIKEKKIERQIIIVTHNANIVVGADAEEIIVANQKGQNTKNKNFRFEYKSGAIEDNWVSPNKEFVLDKQGIQEHICEILEGGKTAFDKRKQKYYFIQ